MAQISEHFRLVDPLKETKLATHDTPMAARSRALAPEIGWCLRCGISNDRRKPQKWIRYCKSGGFSATCTSCWDESTLEERIEHARALFRSWLTGHLYGAYSRWVLVPENHATWKQMEAAVRRESGQREDS